MALAILEFRDDTADSIMLPPYVVGRCGDRGSGHSSNINRQHSVLRRVLRRFLEKGSGEGFSEVVFLFREEKSMVMKKEW